MRSLFVGVGAMGAPMVRHYSQTFDTVIHDVSPAALEIADELGLEYLPTLKDLPADVGVVLLMVPNSTVVESLVEGDDGLLNRLEAGSLIIDMSSSKPDSTRRLAQAADGAGILYVDAPVSGGVAKAVSGDLTFMLGGKPAAIDLAEPHLKPMAGALFQLGPSGSGHAAKALNNLLSATNIAAASEVLTAAVRNGINPAVMIKVINASTGRSQASEVKFPRHILTGTWDSGFAFDLMLKDLGIARELIDAQDLYSPVTASAFAVAQAARSEFAGEATLDHTELAKYYEFLAGVEFRSEPSDPTA